MTGDPLAALARRVGSFEFLPTLFDDIGDVVFFIKDAEGRYLSANRTLAARCGLRHPAQMLGKTPADIFPAPLGGSYLAQDLAVMRSDAAIENQLELHLYPDRREGWCITRKLPLHDPSGKVIGLAGISRDLGIPDRGNPAFRQVAGIAMRIREHFDAPLQFAELARQAGLSMSGLERYFHRVFAISPRQMLLRCRIDAARKLLSANRNLSITAVAQACGYSDHSAFTRQFKAVCGVTPLAYRELTVAEVPSTSRPR